MRPLLPHEAATLLALDLPGEAIFDDTLDDLEVQRRAERYEVDPFDGSYRMRVTELGRLALRVAQEPRP